MQQYKTPPNKYALSILICLLISPLVQSEALFNGALWGRERGGKLQDSQEFGINHYQIMLPIKNSKKNSESVQIFANIDKKDLSWGANERELYWLSAPIYYRQQRSTDTDLVIYFEPGLMSDLTNLGRNHLFANIQIDGRTWLRGDLNLRYGVIVNRDFGSSNPYPVAQLQWYASNRTTLLLGLPKSSVQSALSKSLTGYLILKPQGGMWQASIKNSKQSNLVHYRNWRVGIGSKLHWRKHFWGQVELGRNVYRKLNAQNDAGAKQTLDIKSSYYWQVGLNLIF